MKKTISLILALLMVISLLPMSALADGTIIQSGTCGDNLTWTLDDAGVLTITGTGEIANNPWIKYKDDIKSVVVGEGVTGFCYWAFQGCSNLAEVSLPKSATFFGAGVFSGCSSLRKVDIPDGTKCIEVVMFSGCSSLEEVNIPSSVTAIGDNAFQNCSSLTKIVLPAGLTVLSEYTFKNCSELAEINIPDGVPYIGRETFLGCAKLTELDLPGSVTQICDNSFSGCSALESISFTNSVKTIGENAFYGCDALKEVYFDGTEMQAAVIDVKDGNDALKAATAYYSLDYPFTDIAGSGLRDYISLGQALGIVNGYPDGTFRPNNKVTRAQYIAMLYNMCGKPDMSGYGLSFTDAGSIAAPHMDAVKWGVAIGIISGYDDNTFCPNQDITRAQMAAFSYRLLKLIADSEPDADLKADCGFKDSASIPNVHKEAVNVCANLGIITGYDTDGDGEGDTFRPNATATRAHAATIIVRMAISLGSAE